MSDSTIDTTAYIDISTFKKAKEAVVVSVAGVEGISGFVFDIPQGEQITLSADVSEHYTENGSYINDHIVLKPVEISLSGLIGELVYEPSSNEYEATADAITNALSSVSAYTSIANFTDETSQKLSKLTQAASYIANQYSAIKKKATTLISYLTGEDSSNSLQQTAYKNIYALWKSKQIVSVQTPWQYFPKMAISEIIASKDDKTNSYTSFSITLKELRFSDTKTVAFNSSSYTDYDSDSASTENEGKVSTTSTDTSNTTTLKEILSSLE